MKFIFESDRVELVSGIILALIPVALVYLAMPRFNGFLSTFAELPWPIFTMGSSS